MRSRAGEVCVGANSLPTHTFPGELNSLKRVLGVGGGVTRTA